MLHKTSLRSEFDCQNFLLVSLLPFTYLHTLTSSLEWPQLNIRTEHLQPLKYQTRRLNKSRKLFFKKLLTKMTLYEMFLKHCFAFLETSSLKSSQKSEKYHFQTPQNICICNCI